MVLVRDAASWKTYAIAAAAKSKELIL